MTTEEKAKAYDEALKTATQWIKDGCTDEEKIGLECVFPELRESEGERIRKALIEAFEAYDIESSWNLIPVKHILAWLEKQKEQKPAEWEKTHADKPIMAADISIFTDEDLAAELQRRGYAGKLTRTETINL